MAKSEISADGLVALLAKRYPAPEWAFIEQVRNSTGWSGERTADALAFNCWPSRGMELHGFEVKVYRGDWLNELRNPKKAESMFHYCDRWWVVTPQDLIQPGELPGTWGWLAMRGQTQLMCQVEAPKLEPQPWTRTFIAAVMRRLAEVQTPDAKVRQAYRNGTEAGRKEAKQEAEWKYDELKEAVDRFEAASGVRINERWMAGRIGAAVRAVMDTPDAIQQMARLHDVARDILKITEDAMRDLPKKVEEAVAKQREAIAQDYEKDIREAVQDVTVR